MNRVILIVMSTIALVFCYTKLTMWLLNFHNTLVVVIGVIILFVGPSLAIYYGYKYLSKFVEDIE